MWKHDVKYTIYLVLFFCNMNTVFSFCITSITLIISLPILTHQSLALHFHLFVWVSQNYSDAHASVITLFTTSSLPQSILLVCIGCRKKRLRPLWWKAQPHDLIKPPLSCCMTGSFNPRGPGCTVRFLWFHFGIDHIPSSVVTLVTFRRWTSIKRRWPGGRSGSWPPTRTRRGPIRS